MRKGLKRLTAVVLTAGMFASSLFVSGETAKAEEGAVVKKGTVIYDFKEITDVTGFKPGNQYFFSLVEYDEEGAVASLPQGSAILQFAGTNVKTAVDEGTFITPDMLEDVKKDYASYDSYAAYREEMLDRLKEFYPTTQEELYIYFEKIFAEEEGIVVEINSWEDLVGIVPEIEEDYASADDYLEKIKYYYEQEAKYYPESEAEYIKMNAHYEIGELESSYKSSGVQQDQDGYVTVVQTGQGFDGCQFGTIAYLTAKTDKTNDYWSTSFTTPGWYYGCSNTGVGYVGPFYAYSYKVGEFIEDDLIITFEDDWQTPTDATTLTKDDLKLSVVIDGEEIFIPFFALADASVDPANNDTTITLTVGDIVKEVEVCNVEPGEIDKDVQIEEGAPTVGLEDAVDALKEAVLTEAELKLVGNGVDVDIYMTVAGKDVEDLGEDKAVLDEIMGEDDKAVYLDLKLFKKVGSNEPTAISEVPSGKIKVSIEVPDSIKEFAANAKVVRVHGTEVTELTTTYDAATNKLTFETDKFSTYAIVYRESNDTDNNNNNTDNNNTDNNNNTPDNNNNNTPDNNNNNTPDNNNNNTPDNNNNNTPDNNNNNTPDNNNNNTPDNNNNNNINNNNQGSEVPNTGDSSMVLLYMAVVVMSGAVVIKRNKITDM